MFQGLGLSGADVEGLLCSYYIDAHIPATLTEHWCYFYVALKPFKPQPHLCLFAGVKLSNSFGVVCSVWDFQAVGALHP